MDQSKSRGEVQLVSTTGSVRLTDSNGTTAQATLTSEKTTRSSTLCGREKKKLSGHPKHWPHPTDADLEECPQRKFQFGTSLGADGQEFDFIDNFVKTSKYEWYNFIPIFLIEEFNPNTKVSMYIYLSVLHLYSFDSFLKR